MDDHFQHAVLPSKSTGTCWQDRVVEHICESKSTHMTSCREKREASSKTNPSERITSKLHLLRALTSIGDKHVSFLNNGTYIHRHPEATRQGHSKCPSKPPGLARQSPQLQYSVCWLQHTIAWVSGNPLKSIRIERPVQHMVQINHHILLIFIKNIFWIHR
jgi:hypothetical protein